MNYFASLQTIKRKQILTTVIYSQVAVTKVSIRVDNEN